MQVQDLVVIDDRYYILAPSPRVDEHSRVLKHGETFAVFDRMGDVRSLGLGEEGLYCRGTRHLSQLELTINGRPLLLLSSTVREDNALLAVDLTNPDLMKADAVDVPRDTLHVFRSAVVWNDSCHMRLELRNYSERTVQLSLAIRFAADFRDIFEIRGQHRQRRGTDLAPTIGDSEIELRYRGLDDQERFTRLAFDPAPQTLTGEAAEVTIELPPAGRSSVSCRIDCCPQRTSSMARTADYSAILEAVQTEINTAKSDDTQVSTSSEQFNHWLARSLADVHLMVTRTEHGPYPYAGIPWFSTPFGRDGIITALEFLWINPALARGVLEYLASTQADTLNPETDAEPGKILHETRQGEMAALGEIPFGKYYGTVDATPLFVMLAGAYYRRTGDHEFLASLWPTIERALQWIDEYGDPDGDGFTEYARKSQTGLVTQGWKDSVDSIFHADGRLADGPIALCEVQAYVYGARRAGASLAATLGNDTRAEQLTQQAEELRLRFEERFWSEELGMYVLALDGEKHQCRVRASNAGHCLLTGIASPERATRTAALLHSESFYSGWGVRTVANTEARYNPMSYHNGSIWPHDNALITAGFARYGLNDPMLRVFGGLFDASRGVDLQRMPELFCGFPRRTGEGPTLYPVACAPQAWAAASVFLLLSSCLGLRIDAPARRVELFRPALPSWLKRVEIRHLRVGNATLHLELNRHSKDVGVNLLHRDGQVELVVVK